MKEFKQALKQLENVCLETENRKDELYAALRNIEIICDSKEISVEEKIKNINKKLWEIFGPF